MEALTKEKNTIELAKAELDRPLKLDSLEAYNKEIAYQTKLRSVAASEQIAGIDETISLLQGGSAATGASPVIN